MAKKTGECNEMLSFQTPTVQIIPRELFGKENQIASYRIGGEIWFRYCLESQIILTDHMCTSVS